MYILLFSVIALVCFVIYKIKSYRRALQKLRQDLKNIPRYVNSTNFICAIEELIIKYKGQIPEKVIKKESYPIYLKYYGK